MNQRCRIGAGAGYWGDMIVPAVELIEHGDVRYGSVDLLAEPTVPVLTPAQPARPEQGPQSRRRADHPAGAAGRADGLRTPVAPAAHVQRDPARHARWRAITTLRFDETGKSVSAILSRMPLSDPPRSTMLVATGDKQEGQA